MMDWKRYILNRFTLSFGSIAIIAMLWNGYVSLNDDGMIEGRVIDNSGAIVAQATVLLSRETVTSVELVDETLTDDSGRFNFDKHGEFSIILTASKGDFASKRRTIPLWFRNQNVDLASPLVIAK
jgi:hypothetical protein